jgi:hypothetical protein
MPSPDEWEEVLGTSFDALTSVFHEALVAAVEGVPEGRLRRAGRPPAAGWLVQRGWLVPWTVAR